MTNSNLLFQNAELSLGAYGALDQGLTNTNRNIAALVLAEMSLKQAEDFAIRFPSILTQYADTLDAGGMGTGLNATVFADKDGQLTLAIRGTDSLGVGSETSDLLTGQNIVTNGMAYDQIVALVNWWGRVATPAGEMVKQFQLLEVFNFQIPAGAVMLHSGTKPDSSYVLAAAPPIEAFSDTRNISAKLLADPDHRLDVTGHSLGGHLAMLFSTIYAAQSGQVTVFNTPGYKDEPVNRAFMEKLGGWIPPAGASNITNVIADETSFDAAQFSLVAGMHSKPGTVFGISIENQFNVDEPSPPSSLNHSIMVLTDSLAVYKLLADLAPVFGDGESSFSRSDYKHVLNQAVQGTSAGYERIVDALQKLFGIGSAGLLDTGNGNRNSLYQAIQELTQKDSAYDLKKGKLQIEAVTGVAAHFLANSQTTDARGLAWRYALKEMDPFVVIDTNNTGLYSRFQAGGANAGELDLYDLASRTGTLTTQWLEDRSALLYRKLIVAANDENNDSSQPPKLSNPIKTWEPDDLYFEDRASGYALNQGDQRIQRPHIIFGSENADAIEGSSLADRLYGSGSTDYLIGKGDADYIEGGLGLDIYEFDAAREGFLGLTNSPDGHDTVLDVDGKGVLRYLYRDSEGNTQSTVIAGAAFKEPDGTWKTADGRFLLAREGDDLKVKFGVSIDGSITIKNFDFAKAAQSGYFGIHLVETQALPVTANDIFGDYAYLRLDGVVQEDPLGNPVHSSDPHASLDAINVLQDSAANDRMEGLTQSDWLVARRGGDDHLLGGEERDYLEGGTGHDVLEGGADGSSGFLGGGQFSSVIGGDVLFGGIGNDRLYGNVHKEAADLLRDGESGITGDTRGDVIDGGDGNDFLAGDVNGDVLLGGAGDDLLIGGASNDFLFGDAERAFGSINLSDPQAFAYWGWSIASTVNGATRNDVFHQFTHLEAATSGRDMIYGGAGDDKVFAGGNDDLVWGGSGEDWLFGDGGSDILIGGADKDILAGDSASTPFDLQGGDYLDGGDGDDELFGYGGNDILIGGKGLDVLNGGAGKDIYVFNRGDGLEVVLDTSNKDKDPEASIVVFGSGVAKADVVFRKGSFWIDLGPLDFDDPLGERDGLYFPDFDSAKAHSHLPVGEIHFSDGTVMDHSAIMAQGFDIDGTAFDDSGSMALIGTSIKDRIRGYAGSDEMEGRDGDDVLSGDGGTDRLDAGNGNDVLDGGAGNDLLAGGMGSDDYRFVRGDGLDTVVEGSLFVRGLSDSGHTDRIVFGHGITRSDVSLLRNGDGNLTVRYGAGDEILIEGQYSIPGADIESIVFADGEMVGKADLDALEIGVVDGTVATDELYGTAGNDVLRGNDGDDYLDGGPAPERRTTGTRTFTGDDALEGGAGGDTYALYWGMGSDRIIESIDGQSNTLVLLNGSTLNGVKTTRDGEDLQVTIRGNGGSALIQGFFVVGGADSWQIASTVDGSQSLLDFHNSQNTSENHAVVAMADYKQRLLGEWQSASQPNFDLPTHVYVNSTWSQTIAQWSTLVNALPEPIRQTVTWINEPVTYTSISGIGIQRGGHVIGLPWFDNAVTQRLVRPLVTHTITDDAFIAAGQIPGINANSVSYSFNAGGGGPFSNPRTYSNQTGFVTNNITESSAEGWVPLNLRTDGLGQFGLNIHQVVENPVIEEIAAGGSENTIVGMLDGNGDRIALIDAGAGDDAVTAGQFDFVYGSDGNDWISGGAYAFGGHGYDTLSDARFMAGGADDDLLRGGESETTFHFRSDEAGWDRVQDRNGLSLNEFSIQAGFVDSYSNQVYGGKYRLDGEASFRFERTLEIRLGGRNSSEYRDLFSEYAYTEMDLGGNGITRYALPYAEAGFPRGVPDPFFRGPYASDGYDTWVYNSAEDMMRDFADLNLQFNPADARLIPGVADLSEFSADNHQLLQPFFESGVLAKDVVELAGFRGGVDEITTGFASPGEYDEQNRVLRLLWGADKVIDIELPSATDLIGHGIEEIIFGSDSVYIGDLVTLAEEEGYLGTSFDDYLVGTDGDDRIRGLAGWDYIDGGAGNDVLSGGAGIDEFYFQENSGSDTILDSDADDLIVFGDGITPDQIQLGLGSLRLSYGTAGDEIHFQGFNPDDVHGNTLFAELQFWDVEQGDELPDGSFDQIWTLTDELTYEEVLVRGFDITGTDGDDILRGTNIHDRFHEGAGNDALSGGAGGDSYFFAIGNGVDTISDFFETGEINRILLRDLLAEDILGSRAGGQVVLRTRASADEIRINWDLANGSGVDLVEFADGTAWDRTMLDQLPAATVNLSPVVGIPLPSQMVWEDAAFNFTLPEGGFLDPDAGDVLTYRAAQSNDSPLPDWLTFDPGSGHFSGQPSNEHVGVLSVKVTASDPSDASVSDFFDITVVNVNDAPLYLPPIDNQQATEDLAFSFVVPEQNFTDLDGGDALTYTARLADGAPLPDWLVFEPAARRFSGTPLNGDVGSLALEMNATDLVGASAVGTFALTVQNTNDSPMAVYAIADQAAAENTAFGFAVPANTFIDVDAGDMLAYGASLPDGSLLPEWMAFDAVTGIFSGTPPSGTAGNFALRVTATDMAGAQAFADFNLRVAAGSSGITLVGTQASESLTGTSFNDIIEGRGGNDTLSGLEGDDLLVGGAGADRLLGGKGSDILDGRRGNDTLKGGIGVDIYIFSMGGGRDIIDDNGAAGDVDTVLFGEGIALRDLRFAKDGADLTISIAGTHDRLTIRDWSSRKDGIESLQFANGQVFELREVVRQSHFENWLGQVGRDTHHHRGDDSGSHRDHRASENQDKDYPDADNKYDKDFGKLIDSWFDEQRHAGDALLSWLHESRNGVQAFKTDMASIRESWSASEKWLRDHSRDGAGNSENTSQEDFSGLPWLSRSAFEIGSGFGRNNLPTLDGHNLKPFRGLEEGLRALG